MTAGRTAASAGPIVVLGGAGFIGSNLADSYLSEGREVIILDSLARPGVEANLVWLKERHRDNLQVVLGDIRDETILRDVLDDAAAVFHLAAQVAVTTSLNDPREDFSVNAAGTLHVLEALRRKDDHTPLIFSSTNKVYGDLDDLEMAVLGDCHFPADAELRANGISEDRQLDFCTPYGCSKGVADQYVLDYAKSYGLPTAVLRMSCIYGPRQFGTEDQGWVAHFLIRAMRGQPITVYGDGRQVRDILHVGDAVAAYRSALANIGDVAGQAFNLGGGPANAVSLRMVLQEIADILKAEPDLHHAAPRTGDQLYFVADTRRLQQRLRWQARMGWRQGIRDLAAWVAAFCDRDAEIIAMDAERLKV
ncbi:MAG TPA: NAD-dependent epimerase/dehydratase family protein [Ferrovibrio sp.]|uniref:NAD-dependent epimerase/dehydratase family protein n=1 Tax=Ferrovibrio sp. TaxID=1917215 RepID=UPI002ED02109